MYHVLQKAVPWSTERCVALGRLALRVGSVMHATDLLHHVVRLWRC